MRRNSATSSATGAWWRCPLRTPAFLTTKLFSLRAKLALMGEPWRAPAAADSQESVADFVLRRLGREFLDYAINPFVGGVYAGDPALLSVRHAFPKLHALEQEHGSLLRGAWARRNASGGPKGRIFSFPDGLEELPLALARPLGEALRLRHRVVSVARSAAGWRVEFEAPTGRGEENFAAVVCALPAGVLAKLRFEGVAAASGLAVLAEVKHPAVASVFMGFTRAQVAHPLDGFGVLVPQVEQRKLLGTLFSSTLFPGRAPEGHVALTTFVGGMRDPQLARLDEPELLRTVQGELAALLGVQGAPVFTRVQRWPQAIPQYTLGLPAVQRRDRRRRSFGAGIVYRGQFPRRHFDGQLHRVRAPAGRDGREILRAVMPIRTQAETDGVGK
jgi:oxygen-dependent protoporphyrinogen oxidase